MTKLSKLHLRLADLGATGILPVLSGATGILPVLFSPRLAVSSFKRMSVLILSPGNERTLGFRQQAEHHKTLAECQWHPEHWQDASATRRVNLP